MCTEEEKKKKPKERAGKGRRRRESSVVVNSNGSDECLNVNAHQVVLRSHLGKSVCL